MPLHNNVVVKFTKFGADIINNPSALEPYSGRSDCLINPDLHRVKDIEPKYWKKVGLEVFPMGSEERSSVLTDASADVAKIEAERRLAEAEAKKWKDVAIKDAMRACSRIFELEKDLELEKSRNKIANGCLEKLKNEMIAVDRIKDAYKFTSIVLVIMAIIYKVTGG